MCYVKQLIISGFIIQFKELIKKEDWFKSSEGSKTYYICNIILNCKIFDYIFIISKI